jgi:hypothetical protein
MNIQIFEDQTGFMLFPEKRKDRGMKTGKLFDNKIDLFLKKEGSELEITCYILINKGHERPIGCYVLGKHAYIDGIFADFKKDALNALKSIGFEPHRDNTENAIFSSLEKFDLYGKSREDINMIKKILESKEYLTYKAGDIGEIAIFCRQILESVNNIKIAISTGDSNLGDINITRNRLHNDSLIPTNNTKEMLRQRSFEEKMIKEDKDRKIIEEKKKIDGEPGEAKIKEGIILIKEGLNIKRKAGYSNLEINYDISRINNAVIAMSPEMVTDKFAETVVDMDKKASSTIKTIIKVFLIIALTGILIYAYYYSPSWNNMTKTISTNVPTPIKTVQIPTPIPTPIPTVAPILISTPIINKGPTFLSVDPNSTTINDTAGTSRTFNVTTDQIADITFFVNEKRIYSYENVTKANYTSPPSSVGSRNVTVVAKNENGNSSYSWEWNVDAQ